MRHIIISILLLPGVNALCQNSQQQTIFSPALYYSQVKNDIYKIENSNLSPGAKQAATYKTISLSVKDHPKEEMNLSIIAGAINLTAFQIDTLLTFIDSSLYNSLFINSVELTKKRLAITETGKKFPPLVLTDTLGNSTSIEAYSGKVILIDFWSSWCGPCREQIPELRKLYKKYNSKGFEMIGISFDNNKVAWLNAIVKDKQSWKQYCELTQWSNNSLSKRFYILSIPANYLLDKNGIILGQDLSPGQIAELVSKQY